MSHFVSASATFSHLYVAAGKTVHAVAATRLSMAAYRGAATKMLNHIINVLLCHIMGNHPLETHCVFCYVAET